MKAEELLGSRALQRLRATSGQTGEALLVDRFRELSVMWDIKPRGVFSLGVQAAVVRVLSSQGEAVLKICTLPGIFQGQDAALRSAPPGSVPLVFCRSPEKEAWLLEYLPDAPGRRGLYPWQRGEEALRKFHRGSPLEGLYSLVDFHLEIAKKTDCEAVLEKEVALREAEEGKRDLVHGDAMPENILGSRMIDPTGFVGNSDFDWATLALYSKDPLQSLQEMSRERPTVFLWAWMRAYLSAKQALRAGDYMDAGPLLRIITKLATRI